MRVRYLCVRPPTDEQLGVRPRISHKVVPVTGSRPLYGSLSTSRPGGGAFVLMRRLQTDLGRDCGSTVSRLQFRI